MGLTTENQLRLKVINDVFFTYSINGTSFIFNFVIIKSIHGIVCTNASTHQLYVELHIQQTNAHGSPSSPNAAFDSKNVDASSKAILNAEKVYAYETINDDGFL